MKTYFELQGRTVTEAYWETIYKEIMSTHVVEIGIPKNGNRPVEITRKYIIVEGVAIEVKNEKTIKFFIHF
jgi:hypothetical protein